MIKCVAFFLFLAAALNGVMTEEECKKENLLECLNSLQLSVMAHLHDYKNADKTSYCQSLEKGGKCVKEVSDSCKKKYSEMSKLISSFYAYLSQICTETYVDIAPCIHKYESKFEKCKFSDKGNQENPIKEICGEVDAMLCVAKVSKEVCEDGKFFGKAIEAHVKELQSDVCAGAGILLHNYWILTLMFLALFSTRNRL